MMKLPLWVSLTVGALGAAAAFLAVADPTRTILWSAVAGTVSVLVPVAHKAAS